MRPGEVAGAIRQEQETKGAQIGKKAKLSLFVGDIILYARYKIFRKGAGHEINLSKVKNYSIN